MSTALRDFVTVLLRRRVIRQEQLAEAREFQSRTGCQLEDALVRLGYATAQEVLVACAEALGLAFLDLTRVTVPVPVLELVPESVARELCVLPVALEGKTLTVALGAPTYSDVVQKLEFILNKTVRPVLAPREQVVEAINRYYGPTETESVDSMLVEFTDTAIDFTETGSEDADSCVALGEDEEVAPAAEERAAPDRPRPFVNRRATVRYYHRMNPERMFPLLVVLSEKAIREVARRGVGQEQSQAFQVAEDSVVEVEPVLPGCACFPPKEMVRVGRGEVTTTFWVVPHVLGKLMHARVVVRQGGETLAEVPLQVRVVKQSLTVFLGALSLVLPFVLLLLKHFRLDFESQLQEDFGLYAHLAGWAVRSLTPETLTGLLLAGTAGLYLWLRPRKRDVFWDVEAVDPEKADRPEEVTAGSRATPPGFGSESLSPQGGKDGESREQEAGELSVGALLQRADGHYRAEDYAAALRLYQRAGIGSDVRAVHYFRASMAAFKGGDVARALDILCHAEARLLASEIKGSMWYNMGCFATRLGRFEEALRYLNRAVDAGYDNPEQYHRDPDLEPLRWRAGFKGLLAGIGR
jgi:hypothetical protein